MQFQCLQDRRSRTAIWAHPEVGAGPASFVGSAGFCQFSDFDATPIRAQTGMGHREHKIHRKRIHAQYSNCWCPSCQRPQLGPQRAPVPSPPPASMSGWCPELATTTGSVSTPLSGTRKVMLHTPKSRTGCNSSLLTKSQRRHAPPRIDLLTRDRMNASLRMNTQLWDMIDSRRVEGPDKWDQDRISRIGSRGKLRTAPAAEIAPL